MFLSGLVFLSGLMFPGGVAAVAGVPVGGLFAFLPIICVLHVAVFGVSYYYMKKFKPGGGWCSVFVENTNKEKKTRKRVKIFIKSVDIDTGAY